MNVHVLPSGPLPTNAYLLTETGLGAAVLVDAPEGIWALVEPLLAKDGCRLTDLWLTHGHWDHTQGAAEVVRRSGARVSAHEGDRVLIETPEVMRSRMIPGISVPPVAVDTWIQDGAVLESLGRRVEVAHVPGHSAGSIRFHFPGERIVFGGDVLFRGSVGITDLPGGSFPTLERSIRTGFFTLPDDTRVFPGHGVATKVGTEKASNPYVRG